MEVGNIPFIKVIENGEVGTIIFPYKGYNTKAVQVGSVTDEQIKEFCPGAINSFENDGRFYDLPTDKEITVGEGDFIAFNKELGFFEITQEEIIEWVKENFSLFENVLVPLPKPKMSEEDVKKFMRVVKETQLLPIETDRNIAMAHAMMYRSEMVKMEASTKSEWFHLDKPVGEPAVAERWTQDGYSIERVVKADGEIIWFGQGTNWVSKDGGKTWKYLGTDYSVKPLEEGGCTYPEGRNIWIDCEPPIYEVLYRGLASNTKTAQRLSGDGVFFHCGSCGFEPEEGDLLKMNYCPDCGCKFETK